MSPAFSQDFLKRLSAFSKLSSGSTITLVTRNSPLSAIPEAPFCIPRAPLGRNRGYRGSDATGLGWDDKPPGEAGLGDKSTGGGWGAPSRDHTESQALRVLST